MRLQRERSLRAPGASGAFTLIEILVVIAILAILTAILFPVFSRARFSSIRSADVHQIRQLSLACNLYAGDYDDRYPLAVSIVSLMEYAQGRARFGDSRDDVLKTLPLLPEVLDPYVKNMQIFCSPIKGGPVLWMAGTPTLCKKYGVDYWYDDLRAFVEGHFAASDPLVQSPAVLTYDDPADVLDVWFVNCAYGDSHVRYINQRECTSAFFNP